MLKQTLSLLLSKFYSKQENALISNLAMPQENSVIVIKDNETSDSWQEVCRYIAPTDGYLNAFGRKEESAPFFDLQVDLIGTDFPKVVTGESFGSERAVIMPMRKGSTARIYCSFAKGIGIRFIRSVGGGYKDSLWRAVLCLNSYSNCFWKPSLKPRKSGFRLPTEQTLKPAQQDTKKHLSHLQMELLLLFLKDQAQEWPDVSFRSTARRCLNYLQLLKSGLQQQRLESIRETILVTESVRGLLSRWNSAFIRLSNSCAGGALC